MKKVILIILALGVLAAGGWAGRLGYRHWKQDHLIRQARYYLSNSDPANAILCLERAVKSDPNNVEACRMFAQLAELAHSQNAIFYRKRVVFLEPKVDQNRFDLARTALSLGDFNDANEALMGVDAAGKNTAEFHKLVAGLAWAWRQLPQAETNYMEAIQLEPGNPVTRYDLACIQLLNTNQASQGRATLEALRTNAVVSRAALRELTTDALNNRSMPRALFFSDELLRLTNCQTADRITRLTVLNTAKDAQLPVYLSQLQKQSLTNNLQAYEVANWLCRASRTREALTWIHTLPPALQTNLPMPLLTAEGLMSLSQWPELAASLKNQDWKGMEYLRHAYNARALRGENDKSTAAVEWSAALKEASNSRDGLRALNDLGLRSAQWGWDDEMDQTLWAIIDRFPMDEPAFLLLHKRLYAAGNTPALQSLLSKTSTVIQDNALKNNLAIVTLLQNPQDPKAHEMAAAVYAKDPKNPYVISTYAYSLYLKHRNAEALKLFAELPPSELTNSDLAIYYGIILAGSGKTAEAMPYLKRADTVSLLPEEKALVRRAMGGI